MTDEFYTAEACEELVGAIYNCEDSLKFVYSSHSAGLANEGETAFNDEELRNAFLNVRNTCLEFIHAYDYYSYVHSERFPEDKEAFNKELIARSKAYTELLNANPEKVMKYNQ